MSVCICLLLFVVYVWLTVLGVVMCFEFITLGLTIRLLCLMLVCFN